jgi:hypothetical protein
MNESRPGKGLFGWLGRQVGHIKKAVRTDVTPEKVVYRNNRVEEREHPAQPGVKLRRTTIDEVVVPKQLPMSQPPSDQGASKT